MTSDLMDKIINIRGELARGTREHRTPRDGGAIAPGGGSCRITSDLMDKIINIRGELARGTREHMTPRDGGL